MRLSGNVTTITGAASGIGRATSLMFAREGATVAVTDINDSAGQETVEAIDAAGGDASYWPCDVSKADDVGSMTQGVCERFGSITILFNNAACLKKSAAVTDTDDAVRDLAIRTSPTGAFLYSKYPILHIVEAGGGSIISTASVGGIVTFKGSAPYCTAKAGVVMLMKSIADYYGHQGIRANAIAPGAIDTPINDQYKDDSEVQADWKRKSLLGRPLGRADEVAAAAVFLASHESSVVAGSVLPVDGGWLAT